MLYKLLIQPRSSKSKARSRLPVSNGNDNNGANGDERAAIDDGDRKAMLIAVDAIVSAHYAASKTRGIDNVAMQQEYFSVLTVQESD
jgi:hypothetical protein